MCANSGGLRGLSDVEPGLDALFDAASLVPLAEGFRGGDRHANLDASGCASAIEAFAVQYQSYAASGGAFRRECREHRLGVRHLRHPLGVHEARDFDASQPGAIQAADELDLRVGAENLGFALQAITWPHFHDLDAR